MIKKTTQFRQLLKSSRLEFLMEAHNGLSATIVEEAGFKGIWASGLSISAALGVRDNNEASWTQVLEVVEFMSDATSIPILLDGDTGYGNFNNMRRLVRKLEQRGIAAVCIEDKLFPKTNSFINGERQPLADMEEFAGKIKAVKDAHVDPDFSVVARLEGFIAGWGLDEVLRRAHAYCEAGADALLVHSKKTSPDQILAFARAWDKPCPLIIVPTMYYSTPAEVFEQAGIRMAIWANHNVRASISAMQSLCRRIHSERSVANVEDQIVSLKEVFRLQKAEELMAAEERYLPKRDAAHAIVLAASRGTEMGDLTARKPKAMLDIGGTPLLHRQVSVFRKAGIRDILVVRGYGKSEVEMPDVNFVDNDAFADTGEIYSLYQALGALQGEVVVSFGDILIRQYIMNTLLAETGDIMVVVDAAWQERSATDTYRDLVTTTRPYSIKYDESEVFLAGLAHDLPVQKTNGEWIGLLRCSGKGSKMLAGALQALSARPDFKKLRFDALFAHLLHQGVPVKVCYITGHWLDVDRLEDLAEAQTF